MAFSREDGLRLMNSIQSKKQETYINCVRDKYNLQELCITKPGSIRIPKVKFSNQGVCHVLLSLCVLLDILSYIISKDNLINVDKYLCT